MVRASRVVEVRIAQFRAFLALLLAIFGAQNFVWGGTVIKGPFLPLSLVSCSLALMFSLFVLIAYRRQNDLPVTRLALVSIGVDAALVVLPISLFFTEGGQPDGQAVLNQPSVFAMYLLVIASGLRFRRVAGLGILVNGLVIVSLMLTEAYRSQTPEGFDPVATLAIRQHFLLLASSALLAWLISSHIRTTTLLAAQTAQQATVDGLTGVYNRHHLRQKLEYLCSTEHSFHLLMTDVDHFKQVNDQLGHPAGDRVLTEVARRLQGALRPGDLLARYGGEEFCVVLTRLDDSLAVNIGERLRAEICKTPMENRTITSSVGLSRWDGQEPISQLLDRADKALYKAKESGRNRVVALWPNEDPQAG